MEEQLNRSVAQAQVVNVGEVLTSSLEICPGSDSSLSVSREFDDRLRVACDRVELGKVMVALLCNAVESLAVGPAQARGIRVAAWRTADERVLVEISDTGGGIAAQDLERVFEASFTTKTGQTSSEYTLAVCQRLLGEWGGTLYVRATSARGTSFRVDLPSGSAGAA